MMIKVFQGFFQKYFREEEAIILTIMLIAFFTVMMSNAQARRKHAKDVIEFAVLNR